MYGEPPSVKLSSADHDALDALVRPGTVEARLARHVRTVLLLEAGPSMRVTAERVGLAPRMGQHWTRRFLEGGLAGLGDAPRPGRLKLIPLSNEARIMAEMQHRPPGPRSQSSSRTMAARHGVSQSFVTRLWRRHGLQPHRVAAYVGSPDPDFEAKAAILGLYLQPPAHVVVLCIDEKSHIIFVAQIMPADRLTHADAQLRGAPLALEPVSTRERRDPVFREDVPMGPRLLENSADEWTQVNIPDRLLGLGRLGNAAVERARDPQVIVGEFDILVSPDRDLLGPTNAGECGDEHGIADGRTQLFDRADEVRGFEHRWPTLAGPLLGEVPAAQDPPQRIARQELVVGGRDLQDGGEQRDRVLDRLRR
ncbi:MAG TPA: helix-turn-helix domain-containing protein [bacterium]|nr:helix-turn-helix domain-containing protein [bacterium]